MSIMVAYVNDVQRTPQGDSDVSLATVRFTGGEHFRCSGSRRRRRLRRFHPGDHAMSGRSKATRVRIAVMRSCEQLMREVFADSFAPHLQRFRSPFAFRGMCGDWDLSSSLQRLRHPADTLRMIEDVMLRNFRKYAYHEAEPNTSEWKWLSLAQHHGLPTRLLDWTYSPFVAMHFATNELDKMDKDGVIWMVNFVAARKFLPPPLAKPLDDRAAYSFNVEMLEENFPWIASVEEQNGDLAAFVVFFEPPSLDPRIVNQFGLFSFPQPAGHRLQRVARAGLRAATRAGAQANHPGGHEVGAARQARLDEHDGARADAGPGRA